MASLLRRPNPIFYVQSDGLAAITAKAAQNPPGLTEESIRILARSNGSASFLGTGEQCLCMLWQTK
jgi:hypothetical protein